MIRRDKHLRLAAALLIANLILIWGNSLLPGEISRILSTFVRDLLDWSVSGDITPDQGHGLLRKLAHFTEFASLGMILTWIVILLERPRPLALAGGFAAACIDETIQFFVPERGPAFTDVLIDTAGVLTGLILLLLIRHWRRNPQPH